MLWWMIKQLTFNQHTPAQTYTRFDTESFGEVAATINRANTRERGSTFYRRKKFLHKFCTCPGFLSYTTPISSDTKENLFLNSFTLLLRLRQRQRINLEILCFAHSFLPQNSVSRSISLAKLPAFATASLVNWTAMCDDRNILQRNIGRSISPSAWSIITQFAYRCD